MKSINSLKINYNAINCIIKRNISSKFEVKERWKIGDEEEEKK